jgi:hypothetical protein
MPVGRRFDWKVLRHGRTLRSGTAYGLNMLCTNVGYALVGVNTGDREIVRSTTALRADLSTVDRDLFWPGRKRERFVDGSTLLIVTWD